MKCEPNKIDRATLMNVLSYDQVTGKFTWKVRPCRNVFPGDLAGTRTSDGYVQIRMNGITYKAHRLAYVYMTGIDPGTCIDHVNGDREDNRFSNLRAVSNSVNAQNRRKAKAGAKSGLIGAFWNSARSHWISSILVDGERINLGKFASEKEAHEAYLQAKRAMHKGCTL